MVFPNNHAQFDPFIGVAALALAAIGFACAWRDARVRSMAGVMAGVMAGLTAALMAVIPAAAIPAFDKGRAPSVAVAIFQFGAAVLAAFGLDRLSAGADDPWPKRIAWAVLGFGVLIFAAYQARCLANK